MYYFKFPDFHEEKEGNSDAKQGPDGDGPILGVDSESASDSGSDGEWTPPFADAFEEDTGAFPFGTYSKIASHAESPVGVIQAAIKLLQVCEGDVFVDVGCGKGAALLHAANLLNCSTRCIGIDLCGGEIDCARKKLRGEGLQVQDRVEFLQLDALEFLNSPQSFVHVGTGKKMCPSVRNQTSRTKTKLAMAMAVAVAAATAAAAGAAAAWPWPFGYGQFGLGT